MAKHVPDACSFAPVTVLVDERADGLHLSYDRIEDGIATVVIDAGESGNNTCC
jgi:hypothetical protein